MRRPLRHLTDTQLDEMCLDPEHLPIPGLMSLSPGRFTHKCPTCGRQTVYLVEPPS